MSIIPTTTQKIKYISVGAMNNTQCRKYYTVKSDQTHFKKKGVDFGM